MNSNTLPKIGLLGLMTDAYEPIFPGIIARQEAYAREVATSLAGIAEIYFPGAALNRTSIETIVRDFNMRSLDGILIVLLTYSQGAWIVRALQENHLPLALAVIQPDQIVGEDWDELRLTVNQGVHGAQDNSNAIIRSGIPCQFFAGNRHEERFRSFVGDFARAAAANRFLRRMRVAVFSKMPGMADILNDEMTFLRILGPECVHDTIGSVYRCIEAVSQAEIKKRMDWENSAFEVDPRLKEEDHAEAVRMYLGFKKYLEDGKFDAFTAHFDIFAADGRFKQLPLLAASNLLADGFGYAAEGDSLCAAMVAAAHYISGGLAGNNQISGANFTEMYTMDYEKDAIIFCHAGEGNWATAEPGVKPKLIDRVLGEGGLDNPPTIRFTPAPGDATLVSLAPVCGEKFKLVVCRGEMLGKADMRNCDMPYFFWKPSCGIVNCVEGWLRNGATHHEVVTLGDTAGRWHMLADMLGFDYVEL